MNKKKEVTYDSGTRNEVRIGTVSAVSTAYINSIAKKKKTRRNITQKLFDGG
jgi:hypothetical protein